MVKKIRVVFQPEGKRFRVDAETTIFDAARALGIGIKSLCGGKGICGKCKIMVEGGEGALSDLSDAELERLTREEVEKGYRLACRAVVKDSVVATVPEESRTGKQRLQIEGVETLIDLEPLTKKLVVKLPAPSLGDQISDVDRLLRSLKDLYGLRSVKIDYAVLGKLPRVLRESEWTVTAILWDDEEIIDTEGGVTDYNYGVAVDIGTTKIAVYLVDLNSGRTLCSMGFMNPQIPYGEDVMSRIAYSMKGPSALEELQRSVVQGVNEALGSLTEEAGVRLENIYEMTFVGNTAMHHLLLKIDPKFVALAPYTPVVRGALRVKTSTLGLNANPNANAYFLPVIAGFVGSDCVADILATEIYKSKALSFLIDVGTNTEIVIGNEEKLVACSCASGPAFEGAHIEHGMRAATGAIERVKIDPKNLEAECQTVNRSKPIGICGSALVDIIAEMLKVGVIDLHGTFNRDLSNPNIRRGKDGAMEFVLARKEETATNRDITITQRDVRELQLAKAAMYTGASILMKKLGISVDDIERAFIAGAFGNYIDPENARIIGMYPDIPSERVKFVGNAAGSGARMALISGKAKRIAETISRSVNYVELAADPFFQSEFVKAIYLPHQELERFPRVKELLKTHQK